MAGMLPRVLAVFSTIILCLTLTGCGDDRPEKIAQYQQLSQQRLGQLNSMLNAGELRNATLLNQYANLLKQSKPDLVPLLDELAKDAGTSGPMFQSLQRRTSELSDSANFIDLDQQLEEAQNIYQAADSSLYNDMLSDPVNVVADLSGGQLARVNSISREAAALANGSEDFGAGSQLVGNPSYGSWQSNSSGMSFWAWYGMYSMFSNVMNPVRYDRWSNNRGYSYYNDVGRYRYTSPKQASAQNRTYENTKKTFNSQGKQFNSPYAKSRTGSTSLSRQSTSAPKASTTGTRSASSSKFRSTYSKDSSFRNSSSRTTRGVRRGK
ncbi:hypothetical protein Q4601_04335 [Shewanella sp. 1_MG-2023]|uniref:hypothetical protein n=1 Tax=unclassified Shewanella TaxID=196818 RepID=UPI000C82ECA7|nr:MULTISPECIES: hypothetical protein [unclassified Shewanella]MCC4832575.1 hypothetical protein [Shewanella sp. 10N.7]MDO6611444.1 hypothetical protein [Shewanella sp. 7_MG-2023]MDO6771299.1 hypothetical protein [Shewanella sp. 2_MG-2023]MDO6793525.1 hypothetical protein [Shewanella sp. 1_MG-2023]PMG76514.1 hypothetical protein BCU84_13210 [Shewanella sp. 10N.286.51.B7]